MDCLRGCLATLSVLVIRIALHEKAYRFIVCEFGGFQNVLRDACVRAIPYIHRDSFPIHRRRPFNLAALNVNVNKSIMCACADMTSVS